MTKPDKQCFTSACCFTPFSSLRGNVAAEVQSIMKNTKTFIALKKYITEIIRLLSNFDTIILYLMHFSNKALQIYYFLL